VIAIAALFVLLGYQNLYYGLDQLGHGNNGYWSLLIPGKFTPGIPKDNASGSSGLTAAQAQALLPGSTAPSTAPTTGAASGNGQTGGLGVPGVIGR
jgi:hypothetical protein